MKRIKSILLVTPDYPYKEQYVYTFVKNLCDEFVKLGCAVTVLCPQSKTSSIKHKRVLRPVEWSYMLNGSEVKVYQPYRISAPHRFHNINNFLTRLCLKFFFKKHPLTADVCYCHFWNSAYSVLPYVQRRNIPIFVASGESEISYLFKTSFGLKKLREFVKGVICVSGKNRDESVALGLTTVDKCKVFPNAVNGELFHKRNREKCRNQLGISQDYFIVAFVGWFIERKGPLRVAAALNKVGDVKSFFIGKGDQDPQSEGILYKGALQHKDIPLYLGAADVFVLPTLHEGCCNAVVEAMACGLPVISSNLPFNWDVLDKSNSIMVDPSSIDDIANAIRELKNNIEKRKTLSDGALKKAEALTIDQRSKGIMSFIEKMIVE